MTDRKYNHEGKTLPELLAQREHLQMELDTLKQNPVSHLFGKARLRWDERSVECCYELFELYYLIGKKQLEVAAQRQGVQESKLVTTARETF